jgi:hypothetical protein
VVTADAAQLPLPNGVAGQAAEVSATTGPVDQAVAPVVDSMADGG